MFLDLEDVSGIPTISILSSNGPIIHDVTDIDENSSAGLIEHPVETDGEQAESVVEPIIDGSPLISEVFGTDISDLPIAVDDPTSHGVDNVPDDEEALEEE